MQVGSLHSKVTSAQQQPVKKSNAKRTAAYIGAGIGTAAAITGAIVYRKNIANAFKAFKDMLTPLKTTIGDNMSDIGAKAKDKAGKVAQKVKNTVDDGVEVLKEQAAKGKEKLSETAEKVKDKVDDGVDALKDKAAKGKEKLSETAEKVKDKVDEGVDALKEKAGQVKDDVKEKIANSETAQNIKNEAKNIFQKTGEFFKKGFNKTAGFVKTAFNWVKDKVVNAYNQIKTFLANMKKEAAEQVAQSPKQA